MRNILTQYKIIRDYACMLILVTGFLLSPQYVHCQEAKVNKRKTEREHRRKEQEAKKEYDKRVKQHYQMQTKEAQKRMKKTKKEAPGNTPLK